MGVAELTELLLAETPSDPLDSRLRGIRSRIAACRTEKLGGAILCCPSCGAQVVVFNPCHQRGCPKCALTVQYQWQKRILNRLLPVAHYHLVFSAPPLLTAAWRTDPKAVIESLFAAVNRTLLTLSKRTSLRFAVMMLFHSHASGISYKPHLHCLLSAGGIDSQGRWKSYRGINEKLLREEFHRWMLEQVSKRLSAQTAAALHHTSSHQWPVYAVYHPDGPAAVVGYFARTFHGLLIDPKEQFSYDAQTVQFTCHHLGTEHTTTLSRGEFLSRYFAHIPPPGTVTVRHYGLYATRCAALLKQVASTLVPASASDSSAEEQESVHTCPLCHGWMSVGVSFTSEELPPVIQLALRTRGSPLTHGQLIQPLSLVV
jgi:hypothetical protein